MPVLLGVLQQAGPLLEATGARGYPTPFPDSQLFMPVGAEVPQKVARLPEGLAALEVGATERRSGRELTLLAE